MATETNAWRAALSLRETILDFERLMVSEWARHTLRPSTRCRILAVCREHRAALRAELLVPLAEAA